MLNASENRGPIISDLPLAHPLASVFKRDILDLPGKRLRAGKFGLEIFRQ